MINKMPGILLPLALLAAASTGCAQDTNPESKDDEGKAAKGIHFVWKRHPSVRVGNWLRVDFRARLQMDWNLADPETSAKPDLFTLPRRRFAVEGTLFRIIDFEVSRETADTDFPWKDVYANVRARRALQFRGGRFRIPFSLEQTTGPTDLDFVERSRIAARLAPGRETGGVVHGTLGERAVRYDAGVFRHDGDIAATGTNFRTGEATIAGRIRARPSSFFTLPAMFHELSVGAAATSSNVPEGLYGLRGRTVGSDTIFPYYFVNGNRRRTGLELSWMPGPFSLKSEFIDVREQRLKQSLRAEDLPDLMQRGWYVSGTWVVTGQRKARGLDRGRYVPFIKRWGAVELATRWEAIRMASDTGAGRPSRSTRGVNVLAQSDRAWTFGVNWFLTQWVKMQANFVHEHIEDAFRAPIQGVPNYWSYKFRLQLVL